MSKSTSLAVCLFTATMVTGTSTAFGEVINRIVATVDGAPITAFEMEGFREDAATSPMAPAGGAAGMSDKEVLDALVMQKLIKKEVETQGLKAKKTDIDGYIARIQAQSNLNDEELTPPS